ncbi:type 4a pilus biogenesis protein PilO [Photobacterium phosphoreum]|jgi:type IV pilus assembly protein PilO|uniref:Type 4a pilus biogenesis protein PilO n=1 Tax=Photobacterium phosphoreum TaxID=659 RepID=A0AAW4ZZH4_PHOPO|nr:type 4a pilus biogenesis protein PilO [Photobacterium phosphoreum]KJF87068.1 fimbrial protein [Photobacterium phosphoreum]MCD9463470.1 fimbrial protein [Photobacterium phosphoreum]MCD9471477.1 fimbrial protein [Photobacterium phosphoreum]MCD9476036.1 type 4a pilus biogenesis protein PilO [Photobacterium phosphoreum]MCD9479787.1 type 4a pilus biogenesis protein PilO [Photobacterium phosphoreum]
MIDWRELELDEITEWPLLPQGLIALLVTLLLSALGYWYWLTPLTAELEQQKQQEITLRAQLVTRAAQVAALPRVKEQVVELNRRYQEVVEQLPEEQELASLLASINDIGVQNGLIFQSIKWASRIEHDLYYELPLNMQLTGSYQQIGQFAEAIARLPRIVNLRNVELARVDNQGFDELLSLTVSAITYRFKTPQ